MEEDELTEELPFREPTRDSAKIKKNRLDDRFQMKTIVQLADEAKIREPPSAYPAKIWITTAIKIMESADSAFGQGNLSLCFSQNLRALG